MRISLLICFVIASSFSIKAQEENRIIGTWVTQDGDSKISIKKATNNKFFGEIIWLKEPNRDGKPKTDHKNPDVKLRNRPTLGLTLLSGFTYDKDDQEWTDGTIYNPKDGKTYKCLIWFEKDPNKLHVKGYIGFSLIGKEVVWTKSN
jgi:uncharacterized protein (DUF2147 family)